MKLVKYNHTQLITEAKFSGLVDCVFTHDIKESKAKFKYLGPKIPREVWEEVLSFFRWTWDTTKSESQARFYVNPILNTWAGWAYPQEAQTGMSAKELENDEAKKQREQFKPSEGWYYLGTVHHHNTASAFQSSVDEANEKSQDGLHITIGCIDKDRHDLHARFYLNGSHFEPDMSLFWDIGDETRAAVPEALWDTVARFQMCKSSKLDFPAEWKANLVEVKKTYTVSNGTYYRSGTGYSCGYGGSTSNSTPLFERAKQCVNCIVRELSYDGVTYADIIKTLKALEASGICENIFTNLNFFDVEFSDLWREWPENHSELVEMNQSMLKASNNYIGDFDIPSVPDLPSNKKGSRQNNRGKPENKAKEENGPSPTTPGSDQTGKADGDGMMSALD